MEINIIVGVNRHETYITHEGSDDRYGTKDSDCAEFQQKGGNVRNF